MRKDITVTIQTSNRKRLTYAKPRAKTATPFGRMLYHSISGIGLSANAFAQRIDYSSGFLSGIYQGLKKPPLNAIEDWCDVLKLKGNAREEFLVLAAIEHSPPVTRNYLLMDSDFCSNAYGKWMRKGETDNG